VKISTAVFPEKKQNNHGTAQFNYLFNRPYVIAKYSSLTTSSTGLMLLQNTAQFNYIFNKPYAIAKYSTV
jgi:hypothetical protein